MNNLVSLPMYAIHRPDVVALWQALEGLLQARGLPARLVWPDDLPRHWRDERLLLSQTCGFPLMTQLAEVQTVGAFHYRAPGCEGRFYRSLVVVRQEDRHKTLVDFAGRRAVCNAADSQSGYNALRKMVAALHAPPRFFQQVLFSGSHRQSLLDIQQHRADVAAIDCITWALLQRHEPSLTDGLAVIDQSPLAPGLPLITHQQTSAPVAAALRAALAQLVSRAEYRPLCDALLIADFSPVERHDYEPLLDWQREAAVAGVTDL